MNNNKTLEEVLQEIEKIKWDESESLSDSVRSNNISNSFKQAIYTAFRGHTFNNQFKVAFFKPEDDYVDLVVSIDDENAPQIIISEYKGEISAELASTKMPAEKLGYKEKASAEKPAEYEEERPFTTTSNMSNAFSNFEKNEDSEKTNNYAYNPNTAARSVNTNNNDFNKPANAQNTFKNNIDVKKKLILINIAGEYQEVPYLDTDLFVGEKLKFKFDLEKAMLAQFNHNPSDKLKRQVHKNYEKFKREYDDTIKEFIGKFEHFMEENPIYEIDEEIQKPK